MIVAASGMHVEASAQIPPMGWVHYRCFDDGDIVDLYGDSDWHVTVTATVLDPSYSKESVYGNRSEPGGCNVIGFTLLIEPTITIAHDGDTMRVRIINIYGFVTFVLDSIPFRKGNYIVDVAKFISPKRVQDSSMFDCIGTWAVYSYIDVTDWKPVMLAYFDTVRLQTIVFQCYVDGIPATNDDSTRIEVTGVEGAIPPEILDIYRTYAGCNGILFERPADAMIRFRRGEEEMLIHLAGMGEVPRYIIDSIPFHPGRYILDLSQATEFKARGHLDNPCGYLVVLPTAIFRPRTWTPVIER